MFHGRYWIFKWSAVDITAGSMYIMRMWRGYSDMCTSGEMSERMWPWRHTPWRMLLRLYRYSRNTPYLLFLQLTCLWTPIAQWVESSLRERFFSTCFQFEMLSVFGRDACFTGCHHQEHSLGIWLSLYRVFPKIIYTKVIRSLVIRNRRTSLTILGSRMENQGSKHTIFRVNENPDYSFNSRKQNCRCVEIIFCLHL